MKTIFSKNILPHIIVIGSFLVIIFIYFSPVLSGKKMMQSDVIQSAGTLKEATVYHEKNGEEILWSNTSFSGMPVWRGFTSNVLNQFHYFFAFIFPIPVFLCFLGFIGFYILLLAFRLNPWLSGIGATAYTFCTFNMVSIEAGHINKVFDMALMAPVLAGIVLVFRGKYWIGSAVTMLFSALQIYYAHLQITYYLLFIIVFYVLAEFVYFIINKNLKEFFKAILILTGCAIVSIAPNFSKLYTNAEYVKYSTRGGSELSSAQNKEGGGLDKDYALSWSSGKLESLTLFIPSLYGGSSHEEIGQDSKTYKTLIKQGVPKNQSKEFVKGAPLYWGDQPFTSGPVYVGAIVCFLFVLGIILIKDRVKWWILAVSALAIVLAWGKNFMPVTDFFLDYVPLYNKFRSVTMIFAIVQVSFVLLAFVFLHQLLTREIQKQNAIKGLKIATGICGGLALVLIIFGGGLFDFSAEGDKNLPEWLLGSLVEDREDRFRSDAIRSLIFVLLTSGVLWGFLENKLKEIHVYIALALLTLIDLWAVDKRYLNKDDFQYTKDFERKIFAPTAANELILQDTDPNFRVLNLTLNPFTDATTSYFHKSVGGYSAIKLGRYQELIEHHLSKNNMAVLNMLNTKYFIIPDRQTQEPVVQRNPEALGNAWFVDSIRIVKNADEEIDALNNFTPAITAVVDQRFAEYLKGFESGKGVSGNLQLISYHPNRLSYKSETTKDQFAVFSEIYFQPGWQAYLNEKPVDHIRVNYVLRGMKIPAGTNTIEFKFEPEFYFKGELISKAGSALLIVVLLLITGRQIWAYNKRRNAAA